MKKPKLKNKTVVFKLELNRRDMENICRAMAEVSAPREGFADYDTSGRHTTRSKCEAILKAMFAEEVS